MVDQGEPLLRSEQVVTGVTVREGCQFPRRASAHALQHGNQATASAATPTARSRFRTAPIHPTRHQARCDDGQLINAGVPEHHIMSLHDDENFTTLLDPIPYPYDTQPLRVVKQMLRWYGTADQYVLHPISKITNPLPPFIPGTTIPHSFDFSSIELLTNTIVTGEPAWTKVFEGFLKETYREVAIDSGTLPATALPLSHNELATTPRPSQGH